MKRAYIAAGLSLVIAAATARGHEGRASVNGLVTEVDQAAGRVTLDHDEIPNLQMAPMTMVYPVKNPAMLKGLKAGDKVKFEAGQVNGIDTVIEIEKAK